MSLPSKKEALNIAINTRLLLPKGHKEGIARYIYELTKRLVENHPEHQFFFFFDRAYNADYIFAKNVTPVVISPPARHPILFYLWFDWMVPYYLKKHKIDVFFSPDNFLSLRTNVPQLLTIHDVVYHFLPETIPVAPRWYYKYFMPKFIKKADHIVTVSNIVKEDIKSIFPDRSPSKITTVYNALPTNYEQIVKGERPVTQKYFVVVGSINPRKNTERILLAFEQFAQKNTDVKLVVIGSFMWKSQNLGIWERLQAKGNLIHVQGANDQSVMNYICHAEALVFASLNEGFGFPILEGFACETPIITSANTSMKEIGGDACLLVDPYDVNDIAEKLEVLSTQPELRNELIYKGKLELKKYSWDKSADKIGSLLIGLAGKENK
jgi:glycosyltransferase involved in cell wall biosynthesis